MPMPRQPEVFVHALEPEQAQRLVPIARRRLQSLPALRRLFPDRAFDLGAVL
jgi:hypothetical protein